MCRRICIDFASVKNRNLEDWYEFWGWTSPDGESGMKDPRIKGYENLSEDAEKPPMPQG